MLQVSKKFNELAIGRKKNRQNNFNRKIINQYEHTIVLKIILYREQNLYGKMYWADVYNAKISKLFPRWVKNEIPRYVCNTVTVHLFFMSTPVKSFSETPLIG